MGTQEAIQQRDAKSSDEVTCIACDRIYLVGTGWNGFFCCKPCTYSCRTEQDVAEDKYFAQLFGENDV